MIKAIVNDFIDHYHENKSPNKYNIFITGGGYSIINLLLKPGASNYLYGILSPYSYEATEDLLKTINETLDVPSVSEEAVQKYLKLVSKLGLIGIAISASLITYREQHKNNRCYIGIDFGNKIDTIFIDFGPTKSLDRNKKLLVNHYRQIQDETIACILLQYLLNEKLKDINEFSLPYTDYPIIKLEIKSNIKNVI